MSSSSIYIAMNISQSEIDFSIKSCFNVYFIIDNSYEKHNLFEEMYIYMKGCVAKYLKDQNQNSILFNL